MQCEWRHLYVRWADLINFEKMRIGESVNRNTTRDRSRPRLRANNGRLVGGDDPADGDAKRGLIGPRSAQCSRRALGDQVLASYPFTCHALRSCRLAGTWTHSEDSSRGSSPLSRDIFFPRLPALPSTGPLVSAGLFIVASYCFRSHVVRGATKKPRYLSKDPTYHRKHGRFSTITAQDYWLPKFNTAEDYVRPGGTRTAQPH